jgi:hypothetical protein
MQKVEGSNPFSRFAKGLHLQAFFVSTASKCVCIGVYPLWTGPMDGPLGLGESLPLQAFCGSSNRWSSNALRLRSRLGLQGA